MPPLNKAYNSAGVSSNVSHDQGKKGGSTKHLPPRPKGSKGGVQNNGGGTNSKDQSMSEQAPPARSIINTNHN